MAALLCGQIVLGIAEGQAVEPYELLIEFPSTVWNNKQP
jgi:hypothetical protein